jgi:hypothetical protein
MIYSWTYHVIAYYHVKRNRLNAPTAINSLIVLGARQEKPVTHAKLCRKLLLFAAAATFSVFICTQLGKIHNSPLLLSVDR